MLRQYLNKKPKLYKAKSTVVSATGVTTPVGKSPDESYGELFQDVQATTVYPDSKTFVDLVPRRRSRELKREYEIAKRDPEFNLQEFVSRHFYEFAPDSSVEYVPSESTTTREHVANLWPVLARRNRKDKGSLIALPYEYTVPGGRFNEQFYWDSYFIMLGLAADEKWTMINGMVKNYAYMLRKFGLIPTGNRTYFLSRSQPPFFSHMVRLLAQNRGRTRTYIEYLPSLLIEYRFWMKGRRFLGESLDSQAYARVVRMSNGVILNRYFDNKVTPRPESRREDVETAELALSVDKDKIFLDLRAGAESGWDFSSRWFCDPKDIESIHTTDIIPVDLNCLLYQLESTISESYLLLKQSVFAKRYRQAADTRAETIRRYCWDADLRFFGDYDFRLGKLTGKLTLAGVFPLYAKVATSEQAAAVAKRIEENFLCEGGLVTTLEDNGQQWDSPNAWAPLNWIAIQGLREYGYYELANTIRDRWMSTNEKFFESHRKMIEKYNVVKLGQPGGGGEYQLQDGFGWTNGVYAALKDEQAKRS